MGYLRFKFTVVSVLVVGLALHTSGQGQGQSQGQGQGPCEVFQRRLSSSRQFDTYFTSESEGRSNYPILTTLPLAQGNKEVFRVTVADQTTDEEPMVLVPTGQEPLVGDFSEHAAVCKVGNAQEIADLPQEIQEFIATQMDTIVYIRKPWAVVLFFTLPDITYEAPQGCVLHDLELLSGGKKFHFGGPKFVLVPPGSTVTLNVDKCLP